jgi:hypothetical protein
MDSFSYYFLGGGISLYALLVLFAIVTSFFYWFYVVKIKVVYTDPTSTSNFVKLKKNTVVEHLCSGNDCTFYIE